MFKRLIRNREGLTLVGLAVTLAISAFVIVSSLGVFVNAIVLNEVSNNKVTAINDAQLTMEEIKRLAYSNMNNTYIALNVIPNLGNLNLPGEVIAANVTDLGQNLKEVTVTVAWNEKQRNWSYQLSTRIAR